MSYLSLKFLIVNYKWFTFFTNKYNNIEIKKEKITHLVTSRLSHMIQIKFLAYFSCQCFTIICVALRIQILGSPSVHFTMPKVWFEASCKLIFSMYACFSSGGGREKRQYRLHTEGRL